MGAGVSSDMLKGKTREELLGLAYGHLDRKEEEKVSLGDLMCMADELTPSEIENVRSDFVRIDRSELGYIAKQDYIEYYIAQLADVGEDEFRIFVEAVLNSSHWREGQLVKHNCLTMGNEQAKADAERELLEQMQEQQRMEDAMKVDKERKGSEKRINMVARGEGSMVEWAPLEPRKTNLSHGRFKARMMVLGHFSKRHTTQKAASSWNRR
jgi:hypothetical protein